MIMAHGSSEARGGPVASFPLRIRVPRNQSRFGRI